ncbi:hypothetical protein BGZ46_000334 [Entomortierella lignicola]|nr:hypothetical protein BGZ46_000334 [Entomortierella lignicola]
MFEHIDTKISSDHHHGYLPAALPSRVAKENLERLNQRIQRRRARAHETLFVDLHQGVKNVEAGVHRQVGMVLSRLKEAHASKYAFALTNSFLAQIPVTLSSTPSVTAEGSSTLAPHEEQANDSRPVNMMSKDLMVSEYLSKEFDSITLDKQSGLKQRPLQAAEEVETGKRSPLSISSSGASEVLSASMHTSYTTACSQVLSAALPSFIPSMVAPLVGVFSYPGPSTASNTSVENSNDRSTSKNSQQQLSKELNFPWGLPGCSSAHSTSPENNHRILHHQDLEPEVLDSGILICNSKPWTQAEREAVYLAVTRYHLLGQWSKIREMLNLHRTDEEIEAEYTKLYGHREGMTGISDDEDEKSLGDMDEDVDEESMISAVFMKIDGQQQYQNQQYQEIGVSQLGRDKRDGSEPIRIFKNELMINNHFTLEEIPTRL